MSDGSEARAEFFESNLAKGEKEYRVRSEDLTQDFKPRQKNRQNMGKVNRLHQSARAGSERDQNTFLSIADLHGICDNQNTELI